MQSRTHLGQPSKSSGAGTAPTTSVDHCLAGERLWGDDFSVVEIEEWFEDERDAYYSLAPRNLAQYVYEYHALNWYHGFRHLPPMRFRRILGLGSAYGHELLPVAGWADDIAILETSKDFTVQEIDGKPVKYVKPRPDGTFPFSDGEFDLIVCFGVLHHIPNVTKVVGEMARCISPGGYALVREPIISMGDWRKPRPGLTRRERGIPLNILSDIIHSCRFEVIRERKCMFSLTSRLNYVMRSPVYNSILCTAVDAFICNLPIWPTRYHARSTVQKLRPWCVFCVLRRNNS